MLQGYSEYHGLKYVVVVVGLGLCMFISAYLLKKINYPSALQASF